MRTAVCVKRVPAPGARINISADGQSIDTTHLAFTTSPHEECAVEEALRLTEKHGGDVTVFTLGAGAADEQLRYGLSLGAQHAVLLPTDGTDWDPQRTAAALADAIREREARDGQFDLILFGNESADSGGFQVGIRVANALGRACVNGIKGIDIADGIATARRESDVGLEVYELAMPAVLGVKEGINLPRYPTLKGRLSSKKADVDVVTPAGVAGGQIALRLLPAAEQVSETVILGHGPDAAPAIVDLLEELGLLS